MVANKEAFEVSNGVVERVFVDVMNVVSRRDRTMFIFPDVPVQETSTRLGSIKIVGEMLVLTLGVPAVPAPSIYNNVYFRLVRGPSAHQASSRASAHTARN